MTHDAQTAAAPRGLGLGYILYQQTASVIGAFALIAYFGHFAQFDWRGAIAGLVSAWDTYIRPAVKWLLDATVIPAAWRALHQHLTLTQDVRDYISVGLVLVFSVLRAQYWEDRQLGRTFIQGLAAFARDWAFAPIMIVAWPAAIAVLLVVAVLGALNARDEKWRIDGMFSMMSLAPFFYLALLLAANYLLLKPVA